MVEHVQKSRHVSQPLAWMAQLREKAMNALLSFLRSLWSWIRTSKPKVVTLDRSTPTHHNRPSGGTW